MLKNILNLNGVQFLNRKEQSEIHGGNSIDDGFDKPKGKCCWDAYPTSCSECVEVTASCVPGSHIVAC